MTSDPLWKYCTSEQIREALRSFRLLDGIAVKKEKELACLYAVSNHIDAHYHTVSIKKKNGGVRRLQVPDALLRTIQKNIVRHILCDFPVSECASAYRPGTSVLDNAVPHVGAAKVMKLDIRHFFESISFPLVYQYAFPAEYFPPAIRMMLTTLCCYKDALPQGAPTSPAVSNLVMRSFDVYMETWCRGREIRYTRYCDDMTFSGEFDAKELKNKVRGYLLSMGFELNERKTRVQRQNSRQTVTGIVVNEKPQVIREYRRKLRAECYYCLKYGVESHLEHAGAEFRMQDGKADPEKYLQHLLGKINYVLMINPQDSCFQKIRGEILELYRKQGQKSVRYLPD